MDIKGFTLANGRTVLAQYAGLAIAAVGMTFVIVSGGTSAANSQSPTSTQRATPTQTQMSAKLKTANRMNSRLM